MQRTSTHAKVCSDGRYSFPLGKRSVSDPRICRRFFVARLPHQE
jgi:hypothetical protein